MNQLPLFYTLGMSGGKSRYPGENMVVVTAANTTFFFRWASYTEEESDRGDAMTVYVDVVMALNFLVDLFLLLGTNRLCGCITAKGKVVAAAALGGVYGGACLIPGFSFLGNLLWRIIVWAMMCGIAFGWNHGALRRSAIFLFLTMALGGIAQGVYGSGILGLICSVVVLFLLCAIGFRGRIRGGQHVPVILRRGSVRYQLMALRDTGNTLIDPITGQSVLVAGAEVACQLLGLSLHQLQEPVETMATVKIPGLRLIPYRSVGCSSGMLLAANMDEVLIDGQPSGKLVAFAPQTIGEAGMYQALAGGIG